MYRSGLVCSVRDIALYLLILLIKVYSCLAPPKGLDDPVAYQQQLDCPRIRPGQGQLIFADSDPDPPDPGPTLLDPNVKLFLESRRICNVSGYI